MIKIAGLFIAWFALWLGIAGTFRPEAATFTTDKMSMVGPFDITGKLTPTPTKPAVAMTSVSIAQRPIWILVSTTELGCFHPVVTLRSEKACRGLMSNIPDAVCMKVPEGLE